MVGLGWLLAALSLVAGAIALIRRPDRSAALPLVAGTIGIAIWNVGAAHYAEGPLSPRASAVYLTGVALAVSSWAVVTRRLVYRTWRPGPAMKLALLADPLIVGASIALPPDTWRSLFWTDGPWRHEELGILYEIHNPWCSVLIAVGAAALVHHVERVSGLDRLLAALAILAVSLGVGGQMTGVRVMAPAAFLALMALLAMWARQAPDSLTALAEIAERDPVTGALGRAGLDTVLEHGTRLARRGGEPLSVMVIDIDDFKGVNDEHGHVVGDRALRHVVSRIRATVGGIVGRFGGDEFVVVLYRMDVVAANRLALRVVNETNQPFEVDGEQARLTVSVGVAEYDGHGTVEELLADADRAMYTAKRRGGGGFSSPAGVG